MKYKVIQISASGMETSGHESLAGFSDKTRPMIDKLLIPEYMIQKRVKELAEQISRDYNKDNISPIQMLIVLKGAMVFAIDLARQIYLHHGPEIRFNVVEVSSYGDAITSTGIVKIHGGLPKIFHKHVLIVEDIVDTGLTLAHLKDYLIQERQAADIRICALLDKVSCRLQEHKEIAIDYKGFEIPELFVAGYGMDCAEHLRELPFIVSVNKKYFEKK